MWGIFPQLERNRMGEKNRLLKWYIFFMWVFYNLTKWLLSVRLPSDQK